jgi:hypothetical protein
MSSVENILPTKVFPNYGENVVYDINIAVLIHCAGGDLSRVKCMQQLGLLNPGNLKVHITLIGSPGDAQYLDELRRHWVATAEVTILEMGSRHPVPKIHGYYFWLLEIGPRARWHARVDDDSITDIAAAVDFLDRTFGDAPVHVATGPVIPQEHQAIFVPFLLEKGIFLEQVHTEWESSFTTASGMSKIFSDLRTHDMLVETGNLFTAPGDRTLALAAHLAGVPVIENPRSRWNFEVDRLTFFGGDLHHVHYVPWHNPDIVTAMAMFLAPARSGVDQSVIDQILGSPLHLYIRPRSVSIVTLLPGGKLVGATEAAASDWEFQDGELIFKAPDGDPVLRFTALVSEAAHLGIRGECLRTGATWALGTSLPLVSRSSPRQRGAQESPLFLGPPERAHYVRLGHDRKVLSFSKDGTVEEGAGPHEKRWRLRRHRFETVFEIMGDSGVTCTLSEHEDGIWRGQWNLEDAMPVAVIPIDS